MAFPFTLTAPSPRPDEMGASLHDGGCTFRIWSLFPSAVTLKVWTAGAGAPQTAAMARDSADGYGADCWSVFVPGAAEGDHYRFVIADTSGGQVERADPWGRSIVYPNWTAATRDDTDARSVIADRGFAWGAPFNAPGWRELVIYQLHIGTFFDPSTGAPSAIDGLIAQVAYLKQLGVNAVQLLPFGEFSSALSMGYNTALPYAIERDYGTPQDFKRLVRTFHDAGMRVLIDVVFNHIEVSSGGPAYPYSLFRYDGWGGDPCGIFFYGDDQMNTPFGGPRPNYGRDAVRRYLLDNAMMWLHEFQVDGIRFDSTGCIRRRQGPCGDRCCGADIGVQRNFGWELMQEVSNRVDADAPWKLMIAEDLNGNSGITNPTGSGGAGFDAQWDDSLEGALMNALTQPADSAVDVGQVADRMQNAFEGDRFKRVIYLESHDQAKTKRVVDRIVPGDAEGNIARRKSMLGFGVTLTTPGIPMFFQGAELLDFRPWTKDGMTPGAQMDFTRRTRFSRYFQFYADMVRLRRYLPGLCGDGLNVFQANPTTKVLAYHRWSVGSGADDLVVVANFSGTPLPSYTIGFPFPGTWYVRMNSDANVYSDSNDFGAVNCYDTTAGAGGWDGMPYAGNIGIGPYSLVILGR